MSAELEEKQKNTASETALEDEDRKRQEMDPHEDDLLPRDEDERSRADGHDDHRGRDDDDNDNDRDRYDDRGAERDFDDEEEGRRRRRDRSPSSPPRSPAGEEKQPEAEAQSEAEVQAEAEAQAVEDEAVDSTMIDDYGRKLFVGGIPWKWGDKELKDHFSTYAKIVSTSVSFQPYQFLSFLPSDCAGIHGLQRSRKKGHAQRLPRQVTDYYSLWAFCRSFSIRRAKGAEDSGSSLSR
jgi:hypothetical protein